MSYFLILAAAGATFLGGAQTNLTVEEALELGITVSATNLNNELLHPYPLVFVTLDLSQFEACEIKGVYAEFYNDLGQLVFGTSIAMTSGDYNFQLLKEYLSSSSLLVGCDMGPNSLDHSYKLNVLENVQAP